jgi:DNA-binding protein WhiA
MSMTSELRDELLHISSDTDSCRRTMVAAMLRVCAELRVSRVGLKVEAEVPTETVARLLRREIAQLYSIKAEIVAIASTSYLKGRYHVVVTGERGGGRLAAETGLMNVSGEPIWGMPSRVVGGSPGEVAAALRGMFLVCGTISGPTHSPVLELCCPAVETAYGAHSCAARVGVVTLVRELRSVSRVLVRDADDIGRLLGSMGSTSGRMLWERHRARQTMIRRAHLANANTVRATRAAVSTSAKVAEALAILGDDAPTHLVETGRLRIERRNASLEELGRASDPPLTKDSVAGRLRRLLALAEQCKSDKSLVALQ